MIYVSIRKNRHISCVCKHWARSPQSRQSAKLFLQSSDGIDWDSPNPSPARECARAHSPAREGLGLGRVPIPTRGHTLWFSFYYTVRTLCRSLKSLMTGLSRFLGDLSLSASYLFWQKLVYTVYSSRHLR
jgi:hypothetical protein